MGRRVASLHKNARDLHRSFSLYMISIFENNTEIKLVKTKHKNKKKSASRESRLCIDLKDVIFGLKTQGGENYYRSDAPCLLLVT